MKKQPWEAIFAHHKINEHDFDEKPYIITAEQIKEALRDLKYLTTSEREVRVLCKQDTRENRPEIFVKSGLFILPTRNGTYAIIKGEGYVDLPVASQEEIIYASQLDFELKSSKIGDSEMQHIDYAYANNLLRTFAKDNSLVLTIRGRKYTPFFQFRVGKFSLEVESVQTEIDAGYEGKEQLLLIEAKNIASKNVIIRQLYYPFRQWSHHTGKKVRMLFFEKVGKIEISYLIREAQFKDINDYNSIEFFESKKYKIVES